MPEQTDLELQQTHTQKIRGNTLHWLLRSSHPYNYPQSALTHGSERFSTRWTPISPAPLVLVESAEDENMEGPKSLGARGGDGEFISSDSGTEADDEHFMKGLPAPQLRLHKGLRGAEPHTSGSASSSLSAATVNDDIPQVKESLRISAAVHLSSNKRDLHKAIDRFRRKRKLQVIRRSIEAGILLVVCGILWRDFEVRKLVYFWKKELAWLFSITLSLFAIYPLRILKHYNSIQSWKHPLRVALPASFDPAPILYPPFLTILVSLLIFRMQPLAVGPSIILGISSLPRDLIPSTGGPTGSNITQWFLSSLPILAKKAKYSTILEAKYKISSLNPEVLILIAPLHQSLRDTLAYLTTNSLLPTELQLLSEALIMLLLMAKSPQAIILKSLLWVGGLGILISCSHVLKWSLALARIPRWRFRRTRLTSRSSVETGVKCLRRPFSYGKKVNSVFARDRFITDSSDFNSVTEHKIHGQCVKYSEELMSLDGTCELMPEPINNSSIVNKDQLPPINRRRTLSFLASAPPRPSKRTHSVRRKRAISCGSQLLCSLTPAQANLRKWTYATYVYLCILTIVIFGIRKYVGNFALSESEPIGWALGYILGDLYWFRMKVVTSNFQGWIQMPPRSGIEHQESCSKGWIEHLRHVSFGEANTRLILCGYWLGIIVVGLAIVLRLFSVYEVDTRRKVFHFMMVAMFLPATYVDPAFVALALSLVLAVFLLLDLFRASQLPPLSKPLAYFLTPYVDGRDLKGPVVISHIFLLIGCAVPLWLTLASLPRIGSAHFAGWEVASREVSMVSGVICVGMGDAVASLVGRRYGRHKWFWGGGKSIEGSLAFATAVGLALVLAKAWLQLGGWSAHNDDTWLMTFGKVGIAAFLACLTEAVLTGGNDNVIVPVVFWLCVKGLDL